MAKKAKKANKVAEVNVATQNVVEDVFGTAPVGMFFEVGVSAEAVAAYENKGNGGSKEVFDAGGNCPFLTDEVEVKEEKAVETQAVEIPVGGFNRAGMDALMTEQIGPETKVVNVAKAVRKSKIRLSGGYRGTVRQMLLENATGEQIIKTIAAMYMEEGKSYEYGFDRGKRILGDMERELKLGVFSKEA
jgi:hypothetical protein